MNSVTHVMRALQIWYQSKVMIFLDGSWSMSSKVRSVRRLVIEIIIGVESHCIVRDPSY